MNGRELLEYAAKAAGYEYIYFPPAIDGSSGEYLRIKNHGNRWNPLTDDGDALRLAVKLKMSVWTAKVVDDEIEKDPYAATRKAIVRAAAEIGKGIQQEYQDDMLEDNYYKTQAESEEYGRANGKIGKEMP